MLASGKVRGILILLCMASFSLLVPVSQRYRRTNIDQSDRSCRFSKPTSTSWVSEFKPHERRIFSQNGEDGVLLWIFANIGTINRPPRYVEFGTENGQQRNTRFLNEHLGWQGLLMDGGNENLAINLHREMISTKNINDLLAKYQTPPVLDLLSIDVE